MATDCNYDFSRLYHIGDDLAAAFNDGYQHGLIDARSERKTGKWRENGEPNAYGKFELWYDELIKRLRDTSIDFGESDHVSVMLIDAADAIEELVEERDMYIKAMTEEHNRAARLAWEHRWIPVIERLPESGTYVLAACRTLIFKFPYVCDAYYAAPKSMEVSCNGEIELEYDEEEDKYFLLSGWYEVINNWGDYSSVFIEDKVTHWMPLPEPPEEKP